MNIVNQVEPICRLSDIIDRTKVNGNLFVVSDKDKTKSTLVYADNGFNNSDRVRSAFAKREGIKFVDVRCSRLKNVK